MQKIILFYLFTPLADPDAIRLWQKTLASSLGLSGRIIIADHGINATLGGEGDQLKAYVKQTKAYPKFKAITVKWSDGSREAFPRLSVKVRPELVTFGVAEKIKVNEQGLIGGGQRLTPGQLHKLVSQKEGEVILLDGRNQREGAIGKFKDAIVMDIGHTRDFPKEIAKPKYNRLKHKPVVTYCTGGIRCEVLSKLLIDEGYREVYQLDGGIIKYLDTYGDQGLWEGSLFVFDNRMSLKASDQTKTIGQCVHCQGPTDNYVNCSHQACNALILACPNCLFSTATSDDCLVTHPGVSVEPAKGLL